MAKAAVTRSIRDDHQKNFLKIFNGLTGKHSRWEIWEDFVTLTAIEISNSTDKVNATERTKMYQTIISKYSAKERDGMAELAASIKENGVYQNLTVIPGHYLSSREYISKCVDEGGEAPPAGYQPSEPAPEHSESDDFAVIDDSDDLPF